MEITILLAAVLAVAYYWYTQNIQIHALKKKRINKPKLKAEKLAVVKNQFRCVMIKAGNSACQAAHDLEDKAILMNEASALPLANCDASKCNCHYLRYDDRRINARRSNSPIAESAMPSNKRSKQDRRVKAI